MLLLQTTQTHRCTGLDIGDTAAILHVCMSTCAHVHVCVYVRRMRDKHVADSRHTYKDGAGAGAGAGLGCAGAGADAGRWVNTLPPRPPRAATAPPRLTTTGEAARAAGDAAVLGRPEFGRAVFGRPPNAAPPRPPRLGAPPAPADCGRFCCCCCCCCCCFWALGDAIGAPLLIRFCDSSKSTLKGSVREGHGDRDSGKETETETYGTGGRTCANAASRRLAAWLPTALARACFPAAL